METIEATVQTSLQSAGYGSYGSYATPVVAALVEREEGIFTSLLEAGQALGASESAIREVLTASGLSVPRPRAVETGRISVNEREELTGIRHDLSTLMERIDSVLG